MIHFLHPFLSRKCAYEPYILIVIPLLLLPLTMLLLLLLLLIRRLLLANNLAGLISLSLGSHKAVNPFFLSLSFSSSITSFHRKCVYIILSVRVCRGSKRKQ